MRRIGSLLLLATLVAGTAAAQQVIDPGMNKVQVVAKLGKPAVERTTGTSTYLFYANKIQKTVGMNDVVVLENDKVVDAIFRAKTRMYSGKSSSPAPVPAAVARKTRPAGATAPVKMPNEAAPLSKTAPSPAGRSLPAAQAQQMDIAKPVPQARSAIRDSQKAAAEKAAADPKADPKAAGKPDPKAGTPPIKP